MRVGRESYRYLAFLTNTAWIDTALYLRNDTLSE